MGRMDAEHILASVVCSSELSSALPSAVEKKDEYLSNKKEPTASCLLNQEKVGELLSDEVLEQWKQGHIGMCCKTLDDAIKFVSYLHYQGVAGYIPDISKEWGVHEDDTVYFCQYQEDFDIYMRFAAHKDCEYANNVILLSL